MCSPAGSTRSVFGQSVLKVLDGGGGGGDPDHECTEQDSASHNRPRNWYR